MKLTYLFGLGLSAFLSCKGCFDAVVKKDGEDLTFSQRISHGNLANGINYYFLNTGLKKRCYLRLRVGVGSFHEADNELGMAHMIEHLAFSDRLISQDEHLVEWLQKKGMSFGADANAYTTTENTVYKIDLPTCDEPAVLDGLKILKSFAHDLKFTAEDVAKEKNVIDAEEKEFLNSTGQLSQKLVERIYSGSSIALRPVIGTSAIRSLFTKEMLTDFYKRMYRPDNIEIVLVGDYGALNPAAMIKEIFSDVPIAEQKLKPLKLLHPDYKTPYFVINEPSIPYVETVFSIQPKKLAHPDFKKSIIKDRFAFDLAISMLKTAFDVYAQENSDGINQPHINGFMPDKGVFELSLVTKSLEHNIEEKFIPAFMLIRQKAELGFGDAEFNAAKASLLDSLEQAAVEQNTWDGAVWIDRIISHLSKKKFAYDLSEYRDLVRPIIENISKDDCARIVKNALSSGHQYLFASGSVGESEENSARLKKLLKDARKQKIEPKASLATVPFRYHVTTCPDANAFSLQALKSLDATTVVFSNNVEAVLKPTQFKNDEIVIKFILGDGYGVMDKKDFAISSMIHLALLDGGLGLHKPEELPVLLQDKYFNYALQVLGGRIELTLVTRNKDLPFMLDLVRAYLTDPLYAENTVSKSKEKIKAFYDHVPFDMNAPFQHEFMRLMTDNDHRVGRSDLSVLLGLSREDFFSWHKKYLQSQSIKIVMVGDFDASKAAETINCTFGSLPKKPKKSMLTAQKLLFKSGVDQNFEVFDKDTNSRILLRYPLGFSTQFPNPILSLVRSITQEKLRIKLREKKQTIYDVSVSIMDSSDSFLHNWLDVYVSVDKTKVLETKEKILKSIEKLAGQGITHHDLKKAQEPLLAHITEAKSNNYYWAQVITNSFANLENMNWVNSLEQDIKKVTVPEINKMMRTYFTKKNVSAAIVNAVDGH